MKEIILIDDKAYGLRQIEAAIPVHKRDQYTLLHFSSFAAYHAAIRHRVFMVLLDFFLDVDLMYGSQVAGQVQAEVIIGFSSMKQASEAIVAEIQAQSAAEETRLFAVQKLKTTDDNQELAEILREVL